MPPHPPPISPEDLRYLQQTHRRLSSSASSSAPSRSPPTLDSHALARLSDHFDTLLTVITQRVELLSSQTLRSTSAQHRRAQDVAGRAGAEMERLREILRQCDELQNEFLKIVRIGEIVKGFRGRVEELEVSVGW